MNYKGDGCWNCEYGTYLTEIDEWYCSAESGGGSGPAITKEECWELLLCETEDDGGWCPK